MLNLIAGCLFLVAAASRFFAAFLTFVQKKSNWRKELAYQLFSALLALAAGTVFIIVYVNRSTG